VTRTRSLRGAVLAATVTTLAGLCLLASAGPAAAVTLNGAWAPFTRCPVDNPAMLAADGVKRVAACGSADSPGGSSKIGNTSLATAHTNLQFGLIENDTVTPSTFSVLQPPGGSVLAAPASVPGGLLGLMCPSQVPLVSALCNEITNSRLNAVTATVQSAGAPSHFNITAQFQVGKPIVTLPVKIHLQNPLLGSDCYIGTNSDPIILHPANLTPPKFGHGQLFNPNGTPDPTNGVLQSNVLISSEGDSTFAAPGVSGCGGLLLSAVVDPAIDLKEGLPSPSGSNRVVLNHVTSEIASFVEPSSFAPNEGRDLSNDWHSAVRP
jgi:hypothetical protein